MLLMINRPREQFPRVRIRRLVLEEKPRTLQENAEASAPAGVSLCTRIAAA